MKICFLTRFHFYFKNIFWLLSTYLLTPFLYCLVFFRKRRVKKPKRILVIPPIKIGDLVCSTPIFREIKKNLPKSYLGVLLLTNKRRISTAHQLLQYNPYIDKIILPDDKNYISIKGILKLIKNIFKERYDWSFSLTLGVLGKIIPFWAGISNRVITISKYATKTSKLLNFSGNYSSEIKLHELVLSHRLNLLKFLGINNFSKKKEIFISSKEEKTAINFLKDNKLDKNYFLIGIAVTAGNKIKEWAPEKFSQLADRLIEKLGSKIIFVGGPEDRDIISFVQSKMKNYSINSAGKLNLIELAALLKNLKLFISVDTGPLYMANAMGIPVVDIVGPFDIYEQLPLEDKCEIVQKNLPCVPCSFVIKTAHFCKYGHRKCVEDTTTEEVFEAVKKLLDQRH